MHILASSMYKIVLYSNANLVADIDIANSVNEDNQQTYHQDIDCKDT